MIEYELGVKMTIAISMKVNDGIVLATDSASTVAGSEPGPDGIRGVINIYNNANKIFNLRKGLPIGAITWGSGSIGSSSISTLAKDFRKKITTEQPIDETNYTIEGIAQEFKQFIFDQAYEDAFRTWKIKPNLGFMIVGYSSGQPLAEEWKIDIDNGQCMGPYLMRKREEIGLTWNGETEAIGRLFVGYGTRLHKVLEEAGIDQEKIKQIIQLCRKRLIVPMVTPPMPIQDAIDLAVFLVDTTIQFSKFAPGAPTVGGPIEVAAITKHEGFKWVRRKHYFDVTYNYGGVVK